MFFVFYENRTELDIKLRTKQNELVACMNLKQREERDRELLEKQTMKAEKDLVNSQHLKDDESFKLLVLKQEVMNLTLIST